MTGSVGRRSPLVALLSANITSQTVWTTDPVWCGYWPMEKPGSRSVFPWSRGRVRGLRTAISRAAGNRGMSVETVARRLRGNEEGRSAAAEGQQPAPGAGQGQWGARRHDG